jgi:uncharacterized membrane protein
MNRIKKIGLIVLAFMPAVAFAQASSTWIVSILAVVQTVLGYVLPIVIVLGVIWVIWGIIQFVTNTDEEERSKAKMHILYGIIGLFVIISIFGLVGFVQNLLGVGGGALNQNQIPCVIGGGFNGSNC